MKSLITFVSGIHGNEPLPVLALASAGHSQVVAHPTALSRGERFIDMDLNKAFGQKGNTLEEKRARLLLRRIPKYSTVVDFHTTSKCREPFAIVVDPVMIPFAQTLGLPKIVYMHHNIKSGGALINHRAGVSVEVGTHTESDSFSTTLSVAKNALRGTVLVDQPQIFEVYGIIEEPGEYRDFELYAAKHESFYPVLAGEIAYDFYGLKAKIKKQEDL